MRSHLLGEVMKMKEVHQVVGQGRIQGGGGGYWGSGPPVPPNFIKKEKTPRACARKHHILVVNSYLDAPPPFPKSCIRPCDRVNAGFRPLKST